MFADLVVTQSEEDGEEDEEDQDEKEESSKDAAGDLFAAAGRVDREDETDDDERDDEANVEGFRNMVKLLDLDHNKHSNRPESREVLSNLNFTSFK
jgi:hypothetical protein